MKFTSFLLSILFLTGLESSAASWMPSGLGEGIEEFPQGTITFYNIGAGHCALITAENRPPLLCDAGSSHYKHIVNDTSKLILPIANAISTAVNALAVADYGNALPISLYLSHSDIDHCNLIQDILRTVTASDTSGAFLKVHALLGGSEGDYTSGAANAVLAYLKKNSGDEDPKFDAEEAFNQPKIKEWFSYAEVVRERGDRLSSIVTHVLSQKDLDIAPADINAQSLVLRAQIDKWSTIIPGDATGVTTAPIIMKGIPLTSDILLASHHGSESAGSNDEEWIKHISPRFSVISSSTLHEHPPASIISRLLSVGFNEPPMGRFMEVPPHSLYYFGSRYRHTLLTQQKLGTEGYIKAVTTAPIYTTFTSGHITFDSSGPKYAKVASDDSDEVYALASGMASMTVGDAEGLSGYTPSAAGAGGSSSGTIAEPADIRRGVGGATTAVASSDRPNNSKEIRAYFNTIVRVRSYLKHVIDNGFSKERLKTIAGVSTTSAIDSFLSGKTGEKAAIHISFLALKNLKEFAAYDEEYSW